MTCMAERLRQALGFVALAMLAAWLAAAASTLAAMELAPDWLRSPIYYTSLQAAYRALTLAGTDSWWPMLAALRWLAENPGGAVYSAVVFGQGIKFQYPVTALLPMELLPERHGAAVLVLNLLNLGLVAATAAGMAALGLELARAAGLAGKGEEEARARRLLAVLCAAGTLAFYPLLRAAALGQVQVALDAAFVFACLAYLRGRGGVAGVLLGASALVKPHFAVLLLVALLRGDRAVALAGLGTGALGLALAVAVHGLAWVPDYLALLGHIGAHGEMFFANQSVNGLLTRLLLEGDSLAWDAHGYAPAHPLVRALTLANAVLFLGLALAVRPRGAGAAGRLVPYLAAAVCATVASPVAWEHHYGVLLPCFAFVLVRALSGAAPWAWLALAHALVGNAWSPLNWLAGTWLGVLQSYTLFGALLLLWLLLRTGRPAEAAAGAGWGGDRWDR